MHTLGQCVLHGSEADSSMNPNFQQGCQRVCGVLTHEDGVLTQEGPARRSWDAGKGLWSLHLVVVKTHLECPGRLSNHSAGTKRHLGGGWLVLSCPGPWGRYSKIPQTRQLTYKDVYFSLSGGWKSKVEAPADPVSGEGLLLRQRSLCVLTSPLASLT